MRDFDTAIDLIIRFLNALPRFIREGVTPQTLMLAAPLLFYIFKFQAFKRTMGRYFPGLVKGETVNPVYVGNQMEIKHNLSRLLKERGMEWEAYNSPPPISKQAKTQHIRNYYSYSHKVIQWGNHIRRVTKMKKWIRPDKLAIIFGVLATSTNEFLGTGIDTGSIAAFFIIMFTYLKQNEIVNITRYAHGLPVEFKVNSTKLWFTLVGLALTFYATYTGENISQETIIAIAGIISGYNVYEGKKDVQEAIREGGQDNAITYNDPGAAE